MAQYAYFDSTQPAPQKVQGWYDNTPGTGLDYPNMPTASDLLEVTPAQWTARLINPSGWGVNNGVLVAYVPAPPTTT